MMYYIGTPIAMKENIHGTNFYLTELTVKYRALGKFSGRLKFENSVTADEEIHSWEATRPDGTIAWNVTGDGAILKNGDQINSANTFPFSLTQTVNDGLKKLISVWLNANGHRLAERKTEAQMAPAPMSVATWPASLVASPVARVVPPIARIAPPVATLPPPPRPIAPAPVVHSGNGKSSNGNGKSSNGNGMELVEVLLSEVQPFKGQPREEFSETNLASIRNSLSQENQKQPIVVTPLTGVPGKRWELVDGERRYRGMLAAGKKSLVAIVRRYDSKASQFWDSFVMNLNRQGHTPIESSRAVARAISGGKTVQEICLATGFSDCTVYQLLQLQRLDNSLQDLMRLATPKADRIGFGVGKTLSRVPDKAEQIRIWDIAKLEKTPGLRKLKVDELTAPVMARLPQKGRKRKPSDNAERLLRILQRAETDLAFVSKATVADLKSLVSYSGTANDGGDLLRRVKSAADRWSAFSQKVMKTA